MVIFQNGGKIRCNENCFYNDVELVINDVFTTLKLYSMVNVTVHRIPLQQRPDNEHLICLRR